MPWNWFKCIDALVVGVGLVFTILQTYTSLKSGLSARKSESNFGDARWGVLLYHLWQCCLLGSQRWHQIFVWWNSCSIDCTRYFIRQHSRFARLLLPVCYQWLWDRQCQSNTLTMREVCFSLVFILLYSKFNDLLQSIAIRRFQ